MELQEALLVEFIYTTGIQETQTTIKTEELFSLQVRMPQWLKNGNSVLVRIQPRMLSLDQRKTQKKVLIQVRLKLE